MSAFLCSQEHIHALVEALTSAHIVDSTDNPEIGMYLYQENVLSMQYRYPNDTDIYEPYVHSIHRGEHLTPLLVAKLVSCYMYQACEHEEWPTSLSYTLMVQLLNHVCTVLHTTPENVSNLPGYGSLPWGI